MTIGCGWGDRGFRDCVEAEHETWAGDRAGDTQEEALEPW